MTDQEQFDLTDEDMKEVEILDRILGLDGARRRRLLGALEAYELATSEFTLHATKPAKRRTSDAGL